MEGMFIFHLRESDRPAIKMNVKLNQYEFSVKSIANKQANILTPVNSDSILHKDGFYLIF